MKKIFYLLYVVVVTVVLDQLSKIWAADYLLSNGPIEVIKGFFSFTYVKNTGAAWGLFQGATTFFVIASVAMLVILVAWFIKSKRSAFSFAMALMIGGTIGNLIDRLTLGYVRDFLDFIILGYDFPVFNLADSFLCVGVGLMIFDYIMEELYGK